MKKLKKISLKNVSPSLSNVEMKSMVGGLNGSGTYDDPYQLPEVVIQGGCAYHPHGCCYCSQYPAGTQPADLIGAEILHYLLH